MTQRLEKIKTSTDIPQAFKDVLELQVVDSKIEAVIITKDGETIRIVCDGTYSNNLKVLKAEAKEEKKVYIVSGTISDVEIVPKGFDDEYEADEFIRMHDYNSNLVKQTTSVFVDKVSL